MPFIIWATRVDLYQPGQSFHLIWIYTDHFFIRSRKLETGFQTHKQVQRGCSYPYSGQQYLIFMRILDRKLEIIIVTILCLPETNPLSENLSSITEYIKGES
jgi:hypothetical protein